ncbi:MAG: hypothetical protein GY792_27140 [Gammaproteobacteria bacterium]|nr:hypothetical protein [Gammaproteobacteria bacterium]
MLTLKLLGPIQVEREGTKVHGFRSKKTQALLGYVVAEQRVIARETLAAFFWPDVPPSKGRTEVRRVLHNLSRLLPGCWQIDPKTVRFVPSNETEVDLYTFLEREKEEQWKEAARLVQGQFLEGLYLDGNPEFETWLLAERERWRQKTAQLLQKLITHHTNQGDYEAGLHCAARLLIVEPWQEKAHRHLMLLLARTVAGDEAIVRAHQRLEGDSGP